MRKGKTVVEVVTDESGEFCSVMCPHCAGACDAFGGGTPLKRGHTGGYYVRLKECKDGEKLLKTLP